MSSILAFDHQLLQQSVGPEYRPPRGAERLRIMETYAAYRGEWDERFEDHRWHRLADSMESCGGAARECPTAACRTPWGPWRCCGTWQTAGTQPTETPGSMTPEGKGSESGRYPKRNNPGRPSPCSRRKSASSCPRDSEGPT